MIQDMWQVWRGAYNRPQGSRIFNELIQVLLTKLATVNVHFQVASVTFSVDKTGLI